jgi:hypothetical protein
LLQFAPDAVAPNEQSLRTFDQWLLLTQCQDRASWGTVALTYAAQASGGEYRASYAAWPHEY